MKPKISVIIATRNEERNIGNCINNLQKQNYPREKYEIIVIDNGSSDKTHEIANQKGILLFNLPDRVNTQKILNFRGAQVNFGASKANGKIIFFPDADMTFHSDLLNDIDSLMEYYDSLFIPETICGRGFLGKVRNFERSFYNQTCIDGVRAIKARAFREIGGFDTKNIRFGPDDWDLTKTLKKHGHKLGITEKPLYHHEEWMNLKTYISKKVRYSSSFGEYIKKWGPNDPDIKKQLSIPYRYWGVFMEKGKWRTFFSHPFKSSAVFALKFLVGLGYLRYKLIKSN